MDKIKINYAAAEMISKTYFLVKELEQAKTSQKFEVVNGFLQAPYVLKSELNNAVRAQDLQNFNLTINKCIQHCTELLNNANVHTELYDLYVCPQEKIKEIRTSLEALKSYMEIQNK